MAQIYLYKGSLEEALNHANTIETVVRSRRRDDLIGRILHIKSYISLWSGAPLKQIIACVDEAIAIFEHLQQPSKQVDCLAIKANAYLSKGYPQEGLQFALQAFKMSGEIQNDWGIASASYNLGLALLDADKHYDAEMICQYGIIRARTAGHPPLVFCNMLVLGHILRSYGCHEEALKVHLEANELSESLKSPIFQLLSLSEICADYLGLRQWVKASKYALQAQAIRPQVPYSDYARASEITALKGTSHYAIIDADLAFMLEQRQNDPDNRRLEYIYARSCGESALFGNQGDGPSANLWFEYAGRLAKQYGFTIEYRASMARRTSLE